MQVTRCVTTVESVPMSVPEVLHAIGDGKIDGLEILNANPDEHRRLQQIVETIRNGEAHLEQMQRRLPDAATLLRDQHNARVRELEDEAQNILRSLGIALAFEEHYE